MTAFLLFYPLLAYLGPRDGRAEFYPFFNWSLFTNASDVRFDIVLIVQEVNGETLSEPTLFFDMKDQFASAKRGDSQLAKLIDDYANARYRNQTNAAEEMESVIFDRYMPEIQSVAYDVAVIRYHPALRYRTGEIINTRIIHSVRETR